jgi:hypothetical protein
MASSVSLTLPNAVPGGANYLLNCDADGTMGWTDPASLGGEGGGLANVVEDLSPELGADLLMNTHAITGANAASYIALGADPGDTGAIRLSNNTALAWEQSTPGTDIFIALDGSDILQVGQNAANIYLGTSGTGNVRVTGDLTVAGDDITMGTNTSGALMVADGTNFNPVVLGGDATIGTTGTLAIANDAVQADDIEDFYAYELIPIAWATGGSTAPTAINSASRGPWAYREFSNSADQDVNFVWQIPSDATVGASTNNFWYRVHYLVTNATGPSAAEGVAFSLAGVSMGNNDATNASKGTAVTITDDELNASQWDYLVTDWSSAVTLTNAAAGEMTEINLERTTADAVDDYGQVVGVAFIEIRYVRNPGR